MHVGFGWSVFVYTLHTSSLFDQNMCHYIFKYLFAIICCYLLSPASKKIPSRVLWPTLNFYDLISQSTVTQDKPNNGQWWALAYNSITYFTQYQLTHFQYSNCYVRDEPAIVCKCSHWEVGTYHCPLFGLSWVTVDWLMRSQKSK